MLYFGRAPPTKETLLDSHEWCLVTRYPRIFRWLTGCQRDPRECGVTILIFQNLQDYLFDLYFWNEGRNVLQWVEKWIRWIPLINDRIKLNFDGYKVDIKNASWWLL